jgi:hypothetical protein
MNPRWICGELPSRFSVWELTWLKDHPIDDLVERHSLVSHGRMVSMRHRPGKMSMC